MKEFGFSAEVGVLTIALFVAGYCVGPLLWAPLSEQYGRRPIFIISFFGFLVCRRLLCHVPALKPLRHLVFSDRLRPCQQHCVRNNIPFSWRHLRSCSASQLWVRDDQAYLSSSHLARTPSALISDVWGPKERGTALAIFTVAPFAGPAIGPTIGGYIYEAGISWRWAFWVITIFVS